jgi:S1-C subfamily serine protease
MTKLWVRYKNNNPTQVSTEECHNVDDFLKACKKELSPLLDSYAPAQLSLSTTDGGTPLQPDDDIPAQNTAKNPLFIGIKENQPIPPPLSPRKKTRLEAIKQYMFYTFNSSTQQRACVTAYAKRRLATFAHLIHKDLNKDVKVTIYSLLDNTPYEAKVVKVDEVKDLIILETDQDVCQVPPKTASPEEGEEYFQLGLSALTQENSPFSVKRGVFISREFSAGTKHFLGSAGSNPGDSGGGCFSETQNLLFGINVGADNLPISGNTSLKEVASRYHSRAHIVPSAFFD